ncbi:hypothetical protein FNW02_35750 [Komarekiella sp. 'clone 1']|uniref:DUF2281 domain-containing protein n=1 Tax=Komarekiella delphini-convector SJRDD-AB1 TaxID=2593771 RepID=A0AA40VVA7_9NOST|nr:hypothetical protein [Komarekiella delphini-convector]MBD6620941.1 hypothetical protein [Komarekiella delphini-convector SJRDD-AB1]
MSVEQELIGKWRELPLDKQQQVLEFVEFLHVKTVDPQLFTSASKSLLGERLREIRAQIIASGEPLLTQEGIEKEIASRRGGLQETET